MELHIPEEFTITLQADSATLGKLELIAEVSTTKKRMRISQYIQYQLLDRKLLEAIFNFEDNLVILHSTLNLCTKIISPEFPVDLFEDIDGYTNLALLALDRKTVNGLTEVDARQFLDMASLPFEFQLYYDKDNNLKKISLGFEGMEAVEYTVTDFKISNFQKGYFRVPERWGCDDVKAKPISELRSEDFVEGGLSQLEDLLKNLGGLKIPDNFLDDNKSKNNP